MLYVLLRRATRGRFPSHRDRHGVLLGGGGFEVVGGVGRHLTSAETGLTCRQLRDVSRL